MAQKAELQLIVQDLFGLPSGCSQVQLVVGHNQLAEVRSRQSWPHSPNIRFNWGTTIEKEHSEHLFIAVCVKDRPWDTCVRFSVTNPDGSGAALGKWCSQGEITRKDSSSSEDGSTIPPQLLYSIVEKSQNDGAESVVSGWSMPNKDFPDDGTHPPTKVEPVAKGEVKIELGDDTEPEGVVRGQGSGDAVVNEFPVYDLEIPENLSEASTGIAFNDSISMVGGDRPAGRPASAIIETKSKGGTKCGVMVNPDVSPAKIKFWEIDAYLGGMKNNVAEARGSLWYLMKEQTAHKDWSQLAPIFQLLKHEGPDSPIRIEEYSIGLDWTTGQYDVDYTYGPQSGYEDSTRGMAANCINGAEMLLDALRAPWQMGWVGGMDAYVQGVLREPPVNDIAGVPFSQASASLGAWVAKARKGIYHMTVQHTCSMTPVLQVSDTNYHASFRKKSFSPCIRSSALRSRAAMWSGAR